MKPSILPILLFVLITIGLLNSPTYAQDRDQLKFSHQLHITEQEIECSTCHEAAMESTSGADNLFPTMETCASCHDVEDEQNCSTCHTNPEEPEAPVRISDYSNKFSHQKHLSADLDCLSCHQKVVAKQEVGQYQLPDMVTCMNCHQQQKQKISSDCQTCHKPSERLLPASHTTNFIHNHSDLARLNAVEMSGNKQCSTCHQQSFCQTCHEGDNIERITHPLNYQFTHALEAQGKEKQCSTCHVERSFCLDCHRDFQVIPHNHVPGWVNPIDGGRHRLEAANDLDACMSCHEQDAQQNCQRCHG